MNIQRAETYPHTPAPVSGQPSNRACRSGSVGRSWQAIVNLKSDLVILGQFAFGREYIRPPSA